MDERNNIYEMLEKVFANINYWLTFAEAKNAANLAFVAAVLAIVNDIQAEQCVESVCVFVVGLSGLFSLLSFFPKVGSKVCMKIKKLMNNMQEPSEKNLLFYEHIQYMTGEQYLEKIHKEYFKQNVPNVLNKKEVDIANEIVFNASITSDKYLFFKCSVILDIAVLGLLGILV